MKDYYEIVFITTIPAFYKVNLFDAISKRRKIMVLYTGSNTALRSNDFIAENSCFKSFRLNEKPLVACRQVRTFLRKNQVDRVIVSGWDTIVSFFAVYAHKKEKNGCIVESSLFESSITGIKSFLKKTLLKRVAVAYVSGDAQEGLLHELGYHGRIVVSGGCGILNYLQQPPFIPRDRVRSFLYVGQLIEKKGVNLLVSVFNRHPQWRLTVIGEGPMRKVLESGASNNILFLGAINNHDLPDYYKQADVFILPSIIEPWGLVVEEALNNGTPVIVSDRVGCVENLVKPNNAGLVFHSGDERSLETCLERMCEDIDFYNQLRENVSCLDFDSRAKHQVDAFI